jgi:hypothetical protein
LNILCNDALETVGSLFERLRSSYKSIEVRVAATQSTDGFRSFLTTIRFLPEDADEAARHLRALEEKWSKIDRPVFKVAWQVFRLTEWSMIRDGFKAGKISIGELNVSVRQEDLASLVVQSFGLTQFSAPGEWNVAEAYPQAGGGGVNPQQFDSEAKAVGFPSMSALVNALLEVKMKAVFAFDTLVVLPLLAKVIDFDLDSDGHTKIVLKFHRSLSELMLTVSLSLFEEREVHELHKVPVIEKPGSIQAGDYLTAEWDFELTAKKNDDFLLIQVVHTKPTGFELDHQEKTIYYILSRKEAAENVFSRTFDRYLPLNELGRQLRDPQTAPAGSKLGADKVFERAVGWLLSLCGLSVTKLDEYEKFKAKNGSVQLNSVDILAVDNKKGLLLLVGCTIGAPKITEDSVRIKEVKSRLIRELFEGKNIAIIPVIISAYADLGPLKTESAQYGVRVLDSTDTAKMLQLVRESRLPDAVMVITG